MGRGLEYLTEFGDNLGRAFGLKSVSQREAVEEFGVDKEDLEGIAGSFQHIIDEVDPDSKSDVQEAFNKYFSDESVIEDKGSKKIPSRLVLLQKVGLFKDAKNWGDVAKGVVKSTGSTARNIVMENYCIQAIGFGVFLKLVPDFPGSDVIGDLFIKNGLEKSNYVKKVLKREDIEGILKSGLV